MPSGSDRSRTYPRQGCVGGAVERPPRSDQRDLVPGPDRPTVTGPSRAFRQPAGRSGNGTGAGRRTARGTGPVCRPGRHRPRGPHRPEHGQRRLDALPCPSARARRPKEAPPPRKRDDNTAPPHRPDEGLGRSRGGPTSNMPLASEAGRRPPAFPATPGHARPVGRRPADAPGPRTDPPSPPPRAVAPAPGRTTRAPTRQTARLETRRHPRRHRTEHTIPEPKDRRTDRTHHSNRNTRPTGPDSEIPEHRNKTERTTKQLNNSPTAGEVDSRRPADISTSGFPRAASRTRRARLRTPGSPQIPFRTVQFLIP